MRHQHKVWIQLNSRALRKNFTKIKSCLDKKTKVFAVVKSNAYGHGLLDFSRMAEKAGVDGFCTDSAIEGITLRENNFQKPIIVLGSTLSSLFQSALKNNLTITISNWEFLKELQKICPPLPFHLKIDTGMHRQGFLIKDLPEAVKFIKNKNLKITGFYSHLAMPKNVRFSGYQVAGFRRAEEIINSYGFKNLTRHLSATGGILLGKDYHFDLVRCGMGLYGCWPGFDPVLSWHSLISEIKNLDKGDYVGYDLTEKINKPTKIAVLPIGYWHGFDRGLSQIGAVAIKNKRARVLGRVSMDMIVVDITKINCKVGDKAEILGKSISAAKMGQKINTSPYEIVTRINPLIKKIVV